MDGVLGFLTFLLIAGVLLVALMTAMIVREARKPPRHTMGYALGRGMAVDPADLGLEFESWRIDRPGGISLPVWEIEGRTSATDLTVVMVHGWGHARVDMLRRIGPFAERVSRVVVMDLRGHGDAEGGPTRLGADEAGDVLALLERLGEAPVVLAGWSMGAAIAIQAAGSGNAEHIRGVIAHAPYDMFRRSLDGRLGVSNLPNRPLTDLAMLWFRLCGLRHRPTRESAAELTCPLLVIHGEEDGTCPPSEGRAVAEAAPDGAYLEIAGAHHTDVHEIDPKRYAEAVGAFLERCAEAD
jgi:pimeloyl-ACP methyl ester carboxylesterase